MNKWRDTDHWLEPNARRRKGAVWMLIKRDRTARLANLKRKYIFARLETFAKVKKKKGLVSLLVSSSSTSFFIAVSCHLKLSSLSKMWDKTSPLIRNHHIPFNQLNCPRRVALLRCTHGDYLLCTASELHTQKKLKNFLDCGQSWGKGEKKKNVARKRLRPWEARSLLWWKTSLILRRAGSRSST